jgi:N6-L-threonylcarbamoyladenine synthase
VVSGGHTLLVDVCSFGEFKLLGETHDDAVGEAYDKIAKVMGLGYPGGAALDALAQRGNPRHVAFPRGMIRDVEYNFSYSGLKTAVALYISKLSTEEFERQKADIAASFQEAAVEVLVEKTARAALERGIDHVALSGGVAANSRLRSMMTERLEKTGKRLFYPSLSLCTDNAAMIAAAGYRRFLKDGPSEHAANAIPYLKLRVQEQEN